MDEKKDLRTGKAINMRKLIFAVIGVELVILLIIGTLGILIGIQHQQRHTHRTDVQHRLRRLRLPQLPQWPIGYHHDIVPYRMRHY